jgi:hypothetical protein
MTHDAVDVGVNRRGEGLGVDVDRDLESIASSGEIGVLMTHEAVFVLLGAGGQRDEKGKRRENGYPDEWRTTLDVAEVAHADVAPGG